VRREKVWAGYNTDRENKRDRGVLRESISYLPHRDFGSCLGASQGPSCLRNSLTNESGFRKLSCSTPLSYVLLLSSSSRSQLTLSTQELLSSGQRIRARSLTPRQACPAHNRLWGSTDREVGYVIKNILQRIPQNLWDDIGTKTNRREGTTCVIHWFALVARRGVGLYVIQADVFP